MMGKDKKVDDNNVKNEQDLTLLLDSIQNDINRQVQIITTIDTKASILIALNAGILVITFRDTLSLVQILFSIVSIIIVVVGQVLIKQCLNSLGHIDFSSGLIKAYSLILFNPLAIFGIILYAIGVLFWLYALSKLDLSYAYPFLALTYVLVALAGWFFLNENISLIRWIGIIVICIGVVLISRS